MNIILPICTNLVWRYVWFIIIIIITIIIIIIVNSSFCKRSTTIAFNILVHMHTDVLVFFTFSTSTAMYNGLNIDFIDTLIFFSRLVLNLHCDSDSKNAINLNWCIICGYEISMRMQKRWKPKNIIVTSRCYCWHSFMKQIDIIRTL